jgi:flagellar protein FlgJ
MTAQSAQPGFVGAIGAGAQGREVAPLGRQAESEQQLAEVARRFEALFVGFLLKSARAATFAGDSFEGKHTQTYQEMLDRQWAAVVSGSGTMGIAELLVRQLGPQQQSSLAERERPESLPWSATMRRQSAAPVPVNGAQAPLPTTVTDRPGNGPGVDGGDIEGPRNFVSRLWQSATEAAQQIGVAPQVLIAQAALETGWGRSLPRLEEGGSSFNLFSIKAHGGWQGRRATVATMEFVGGMAIRTKAQFRAYDSYRESFQDYVELLQNSRRYQGAIASAADPAAFLQALQSAGYATDPHYARKIGSILEGAGLREALNEHLHSAPGGRSVSSETALGISGTSG